ncbi:MAG: hypothetical protein PHV20_03590 [Bacteroidales bacterium]|nr:hypothetical protein [Bacteroidales bacterium]
MKTQEFKKRTFGNDYDFIKHHDSNLIILQTEDKNSRILVSAKYQAKVFTSTANGEEGNSFGWINYKAFDEPQNQQMNAYGGENRFWLGPEGGKFSLFFDPEKEMTFSEWRTPPEFDTESWTKVNQTETEIEMSKSMNIVNYNGATLSILVNRIIKILNNKEIATTFAIEGNSSLKFVGYKTINKITNTGAFEWTELTGMPCIWMLDMLNPSNKTVIIIPFKQTATNSFDNVATTNYFGEIPSSKLTHTDNVLFFKADGKFRSKLGIKPDKALPFAGSYDAKSKVLTVVEFDVNSENKYLNQEWNTSKPAFSGDAMNAYNDGPLEDGSQMGPFYEIESVSHAAFLKPNESLTHRHSVFHITGSESELSQITEKLFDVSIETIKKAL